MLKNSKASLLMFSLIFFILEYRGKFSLFFTGIVVTNDGNAILRELDLAHPAAKACSSSPFYWILMYCDISPITFSFILLLAVWLLPKISNLS